MKAKGIMLPTIPGSWRRPIPRGALMSSVSGQTRLELIWDYYL